MKTPDAATRKVVADQLYLDRGPREACSRCDANSKFGDLDLCAEMRKRLLLRAGESMADVGCGTGQHLVRYARDVGPSGSAVGFDFSAQAVAEARARGVHADVADGARLPLADATLDALASSYSIYYMPSLEQTVEEWHRVLKPGGRLVVSGPADDTNVELYEHHRVVTGQGLSDSDAMALGYVAAMPKALRSRFEPVRVETLTNPIRFPTAEEFVKYWADTSLFARSVQEGERAAVLAKGRQLLAGKHAPFLVTKRVSILVAVKRRG